MNSFTNNHNLKIGHINIRSLLPSKNIIEEKIADLKLDILGVTETWLTNRICDTELRIEGFRFYRVDRGARGGGVGVYIRDDLLANTIDIMDEGECIEQLWLTLRVGNICIGLGIVYRPPRSNLLNGLDSLENAVSTVIPLCDEIIIMGDLNINLLRPDNSVNMLDSFLKSYSFSQVVKQPTRYAGHTFSLIDLIILSDGEMVDGEVMHLDMHGVTDHQLTYCLIRCRVPRRSPKMVEFRSFRYFDDYLFHSDMINTNWGEVYDAQGLQEKVDLLTEKITCLFDRHAPLRKVRVTKPRAPWFTDVLKIMKKERNRLMSKYRRTRSAQDWQDYKRMRNMFTKAVRDEKRAYVEFVARSGNKKELWQVLHNLNIYNKRKDSMSLPSCLHKPDKINDFFIDSVESIAPPVKDDFVNNYLLKRTSSNFSLSYVSNVEVLGAINQLKSNASGADGLSVQMIRLCCPVIVPFLTHIYNACIDNSVFPSNWKVATVLPLPKVNNPVNFSDLRPISLLSVLSKVFEKIIYGQIFKYFSTNDLFPSSQSGFRKGYSTATVLLKVLDDIIEAADRGETSALVLLDYSKAFDTLDHRLLCAKLRSFGFDDRTILFFENYLSGRSQIVQVDGKRSRSRPVNRGVPQGSILGPLLFVIYTTDMNSSVTDCDIQRYADDTQLRLSFHKSSAVEANEKMTQCLTSVYNYSCNNGLKLNPSKSTVIFFGPNSDWAADNINVTMVGSVLPAVRECRNLGVLFDSTLRFRGQVAKVVQKSYISLRNLYKTKHVLNASLRRNLCESLVLSHTNYCNFVYGPCLDLQGKTRLQRIQNSCIRFVYGLRARDHVSHKLTELKWLKIADKLKLHFACFLNRLIQTGTPEYLFGKLSFRHCTHSLSTRNNNMLNIPRHRTALFQRSFSYLAPKIYNTELVKNNLIMSSLSTFRTKYKSFLLGKYN